MKPFEPELCFSSNNHHAPDKLTHLFSARLSEVSQWKISTGFHQWKSRHKENVYKFFKIPRGLGIMLLAKLLAFCLIPISAHLNNEILLFK